MIWSSKEKGVRQVARVLLIEDNNDIQEILYSLLGEEHEVLQAFSGTEGCGSSSKKPLIWSFSISCFLGKWGSGPGGDPFAGSGASHHDDRSWRQTPH